MSKAKCRGGCSARVGIDAVETRPIASSCAAQIHVLDMALYSVTMYSKIWPEDVELTGLREQHEIA